MDDAKILELGQVARVSAGYPLRGSAGALLDGNVHFVQLQHVDTDADIDWSKVPRVSLPSKREPHWLTTNDLIFSARGTRTLAYPLPNVPSLAVCAPQFFVLSPKQPEKVLPEYLAWQINQRPCQEYLAQRATGTTIPNVRRQALEEMPIAIPPTEAQRTLVDLWRLSRSERALLSRLIENRKQQLDALAIGLLQIAEREKV